MLDNFGVLHSDFPDFKIPDQNVWQFLYPKLHQWGELPAFTTVNPEESISYKEVVTKSLCWPKKLKKSCQGISNPTVAYTMPNNVDCFPLILGAFAAGASVCPLNEHLYSDLYYILIKHVMPEVLVIEPRAYKKFKETIAETGVNPKIYIHGDASEGDFPNFRDIINSADMLMEDQAGHCDPGTIALKTFSSGTTGIPKCIVLTNQALGNAVRCLTHQSFLALKSGDELYQETVAGSIPLAHAFGIMYFSILAPFFGCRVICFDGRETIPELLGFMSKYKPTLQVMGSQVIEQLSNMDCAEAMNCLKTIFYTGTAFSSQGPFQRLNDRLNNKLFFQNEYGTSEIYGVAMTPIGLRDISMTGKLIPNVKVTFRDLVTKEIIKEPYKLGEIYAKSPAIMAGYLNNPEATNNAIDKDGWFHSGDIGYFDENHFIKVVDRVTDLIKVLVKGKQLQVSPTEIEEIIKLHPGVVDVGVTGAPDLLIPGYELPRAFVIPKENMKEEDIAILIENQASKGMERKGGVFFVTKLPRNNLGKLVRKFLKENAWYEKTVKFIFE